MKRTRGVVGLLALVLAAPAAGQDGGTDLAVVRAQLADAGIFHVRLAVTSDDAMQELGPGWYLTPGRMHATGVHVTQLENELQQERSLQPYLFAAGILLGGAAATYLCLRVCPK